MEAGTTDVQKLIMMKNDYEISKDLTKNFEEFLKISNLINFQTNLTILEKSYWPFILDETDIIISEEFKKVIDLFLNFYNKTHHNRNIEWIFSQSNNNEIIAIINVKKHVLVVNYYQMLLLLIFNNKYKEYKLEELFTMTKIPSFEIKKCLEPFIILKLLIFEQEKNNYKININFSHSSTKINCLPNISLKNSEITREVKKKK